MKDTFLHGSRVAALCLFALLILVPAMGVAQVPQTINYQGSLTDDSGNPINGAVNITFNLYDNPDTAFGLQWTETQSVTVNNGTFSVILGANTAGNPLSPTLFEIPLFLSLAAGGDAEMTPRQALTAVGYAFRAKTVETDTLNALSCSAGEIPKFISGVWTCAADNGNVGDITGVTAGTGITGGGTSGNVTVSADTNVVQSRVNGSCLSGSSIRTINANGTVSCEVDNDTTYTVGIGLNLSGTFISIGTGGVTGAHIATGAVGTSEIAANAIVAGHLTDDSVGTNEIIADSVTESEIAAGAVGISELSDLARGVGVNGSIVIPAAAFQPDTETRDYVLSSDGYIEPGNLSTILCLVAPVALPDGVLITHFEISVLDNSIIDIGSFELKRVTFDTGAITTLGSAISNGASNTIRVFADSTIAAATVDGFAYAYQVSGCFISDVTASANTRFYGARIRYN